MDFGLSEEQRLLEDSLRRYLEERAPAGRVREIAAGGRAHDPELWAGLAELGVPGVLVPHEHGGSGLGLLDAALIAETLGHCATPAPFLATGVMATVALLSSGTVEQRRTWLPRIASGSTLFGVALAETYDPRDGAGVRVRGDELVGRALFALDAASADFFLVAARGRKRLFLVARDAPGLRVEPLPAVDRTRSLAALHLDGVAPAEAIGGPRGAPFAIARMLDAGRVALAADTLGACERAVGMAVEYAQRRRQFGRPIGSFQAVKHMCAEMFAETEPARALVWYAAHAFDHVPAEATYVASLAKAHLAEVGTSVVRAATEVHGGIGFTEEHDLQLWFKRAGLNRQLLGGPTRLRAHAAERQGWAAPAPADAVL